MCWVVQVDISLHCVQYYAYSSRLWCVNYAVIYNFVEACHVQTLTIGISMYITPDPLCMDTGNQEHVNTHTVAKTHTFVIHLAQCIYTSSYVSLQYIYTLWCRRNHFYCIIIMLVTHDFNTVLPGYMYLCMGRWLRTWCTCIHPQYICLVTKVISVHRISVQSWWMVFKPQFYGSSWTQTEAHTFITYNIVIMWTCVSHITLDSKLSKA